ncbi:MAG TPA: hypothetical protein VND64_18240 [Pirellulales bacterium]|nr:hypothetical protein [Pirellulales bacterium]
MFSFIRRREHVEVHKLVRRFIDASSPNQSPSDGDSRWEDRSNRTLPVLLAPYDGAEVCVDELTHAVTKDLSSQGLALVLPQPFRAEQVVIGFWSEAHTYFVLGLVRQNVPLGGGFWQLGVELTALVALSDHPEIKRLVPLAVRLAPEVNRAALDAAQRVLG